MDPKTKPVRVLLIAEECNPEWQSVPLVGFNFYNALKDVADVTLVTQIRNRPAFLRSQLSTDKIVFIDSEALAAPLNRLANWLAFGSGVSWTTRQAVKWGAYLYFEHLVYQQFGKALSRGSFDIIHRVTPLTPTYGSPLASWTDVPFVLGPLNGGLPWPKGTTRVRLAEMEWLSYVREAYRLFPYSRSTQQKAACIIAGSRYTLSALPRRARERASYMPENGIDPATFHSNGRSPPSRIHPFRILFVGRLVPYKGADIVVEAIGSSRLLRGQVEFTIVGGGPEERPLRQLADSLGISGQVNFTGHLRQSEVADLCRKCSVFAFPSLREFGGAVVIEAMACGLPCIVLDHGGPAEHVTEQTGFRLPLGKRSEILSSLRSTLEELFTRPERLDAMSVTGIHRIEQLYTWTAKSTQILKIYERVLHERSSVIAPNSPPPIRSQDTSLQTHLSYTPMS